MGQYLPEKNNYIKKSITISKTNDKDEVYVNTIVSEIIILIGHIVDFRENYCNIQIIIFDTLQVKIK